MGEWLNSDGLRVWLGTTEAEVTRAGEINTGNDKAFEIVVDLANLGSASALLEDTRTTVIPSGFMMTEVEVVNETAATGSGSTLNLGLVRQDTTTTYDADGFLAVAPRTDFAAVGQKTVYRIGTTGIGAFCGVPLVNAGYLVADYDTTVFGAGRIKITVKGYIKRPSPSNA